MKKIFTLALACAAVLTAGAAGINRELRAATVAKYGTPYKMTNTAYKGDVRQMGPTSRGLDDINVNGSWVNVAIEGNYIVGSNSCINMVEKGGKVTVTNFWRNRYKDITPKAFEATYEDVTFENNDGSSDVIKCVHIPSKTVVGSITLEDGTEQDLYVVFYSGNKLYANDIDFATVVDDENGEEYMIYAYENSGYAIVFDSTEEGYLNIIEYVPAAQLSRANALMTATVQVSETETEEVSMNCKVTKEDYEGMMLFYIMNFDELSGIAAGYVDGNQAVFPAETEVGTMTYQKTEYPLFIVGRDGDQVAMTDIIGEYSENGGNATLKFDELIIYAEGLGVYDYLTNVVIEEGKSTGISSVAADVDNSNAPVVYYNLQGQRINTPAAGQIVIRKQGTEATKILVK